MHFLCLVHVDSEREAAMTPAERAQFDADNQAYADWLFATGHVPMGGALHEPPTARLIRERSGRLSMTDGPYVETKEHVAGFIVIVADSLEAATEIVARSPVARIGTMEIRQMKYRA